MRRPLVMMLALAGMLFGVPAVASAATADYVALGDSYSSGLGTRSYYPSSGTCKRGPQAYPPLYSTAVLFVACAGASTSEVRAQADAVQSSTNLVTATVGGNDVGFSSVVTTCTVSSEARCISAVDGAIRTAQDELPARLDGLLARIEERGPSAQIVVLGYPHLFEESTICLGLPSLVKRKKLNAGSDALNAVIKQQVEAAGATFVDVRGAFSGHGICSRSPWINAVTLPASESYHPNATGQANGYLPALRAAVSAVAA